MRLSGVILGAAIAAAGSAACLAQAVPSYGIGKPSATGFPSIGSGSGFDSAASGMSIVRSGDTFRISNEQYRRKTENSRREAKAAAARARDGVPLSKEDGARIRANLRRDLSVWRDEFRVSDRAYLKMRKQWLVGEDRLTAAQWAQQRVDWFDTRDAWAEAYRRQSGN